MSTTATLKMLLLGEDKSASKAVRGVGNEADRTSSRLRSFAKVAAASFAGVAAAAAVRKIAQYGKFAVQAATEDEASQRKLAIALENTTGATDGQVSAVEAWISRQSAATGIADDELRPALQRLAESTGSVSEAQGELGIALDASAGTGKSLATVSAALVRANNGTTTSLGKLGIKTKDAKGEALGLHDVIRNMSNTFGGQAKAKAQSFEGVTDRLRVAWNEAAESVGYKLIPFLTDLGSWFLDEGVPAAQEFASAAKDKLAPAVQTVADFVRDDLIPAVRDDLIPAMQNIVGAIEDAWPAIKALGGFLLDAADAAGKLPSPIKSIAVEAAILALVIPRVTASVSGMTGAVAMNVRGLATWGGSMRTAETRGLATAAAMSRLGAAARTAAGIGGMVALTEGSKQANKGVGALMTTVGGAAAGFSVGGPWGALIGGVVGAALGGIKLGADDAKEALQLAKPAATDFADALNQVSGAATGSARNLAALALQESGALTAGRNLGIASKDLVGYVLGQEGAIRRVDRAMGDVKQTQTTWTDQYGVQHAVMGQASTDVAKLSTALGINADQLEKDRAKIRERSVANGELARSLKGVQARAKIVTAVEQRGWPKAIADVARLSRGLIRTPKDIRTTLKALGFRGTEAQVADVKKRIEGLNATRPDLSKALRSVTQFSLDAKREAIRGATQVSDSLKQGTGRARADLKSFGPSVRSGLVPSFGIATSGGHTIGANLQAGIIVGFAGTQATLAAQAAAAVRAAIMAANREADSHSPSREFFKVGANLGEGGVLGLASKGRRMADAGAGLARAALKAGADQLRGNDLGAAGATLIESLVKGIRSGFKPLSAVMAAVHKNVTTAAARLRDAIKERAEFASGFANMGTSVFGAQLATDESGTPIDSVATRLSFSDQQRAQAEQVKSDVARLVDLGLSTKLIKKMQAEGDAAGIHTLAGATAAEIAQFNANAAAQDKAYQSAGMSAGNAVYGSTIGKDRDQLAAAKKLEAAVKRLADALEKKADKDEHVEFRLRGTDLVGAIRKDQRDRQVPADRRVP